MASPARLSGWAKSASKATRYWVAPLGRLDALRLDGVFDDFTEETRDGSRGEDRHVRSAPPHFVSEYGSLRNFVTWVSRAASRVSWQTTWAIARHATSGVVGRASTFPSEYFRSAVADLDARANAVTFAAGDWHSI
jgi:hypothetical protein